jgi:hypothetical protein
MGAGRMIVRTDPMNFARRQQYRRLLRAAEAAAGGTIVALLGLVAASVGAAGCASRRRGCRGAGEDGRATAPLV